MKASGSMALHCMGLAATWLIQLACAGQSSPLGLTESMRASQHVAMAPSLLPDDAQAVLKAALPFDACLSHWKAVQDSLEAAPIAEAELLAALGDIRMELGRCRSERTAAMRGCLSQEQRARLTSWKHLKGPTCCILGSTTESTAWSANLINLRPLDLMNVWHHLSLCALAIAMFGCCGSSQPQLHLEVNPWIGTGGHGHTYPGATTPFGMVQLSPDTRLDGWDGCGGYHDTDSVMYGFSHTHLQGTGVSDYGDILVMPCTQYRDGSTWRDKYKSAFRKDSEQGHAGYYQVTLDDHGVVAELTATPRVGVHRYTLPEPDTVTWVVDLAHRDELVHYSIEPRGSRMLVGHRVSKNWAEEQHVYFAMAFDQDFVWGDQLGEITRTDTLEDGSLVQEMTMVPVFVADFGMLSELNVHVALSFCDIEGAIQNLNAEAPDFDFDRFKGEAERRWDDQLGRIQVDGGTSDERTTFYTALYHATTVPNLASDVDGRYRGTDLRVHALADDEGDHYTVFSLWDTYRALHPLLAWIEPNRTRDMVRSMLRMYKDGGQLPVWELAANYTGCMIGYHSVPVIVDAEQWGIDGWDHGVALSAMVQAADSMHLGLDAYAELGFIPSDHEHESVSKTLEYAFDDACISRYAARHGVDQLAARFAQRASSWKNLVNPETGFIQAKRQGAWVKGFDPREVNFNFTEANGWQYLFAPVHDVAGQMDILGGDEGYLTRVWKTSLKRLSKPQDAFNRTSLDSWGNTPTATSPATTSRIWRPTRATPARPPNACPHWPATCTATPPTDCAETRTVAK